MPSNPLLPCFPFGHGGDGCCHHDHEPDHHLDWFIGVLFVPLVTPGGVCPVRIVVPLQVIVACPDLT
jgi:hypothetical protein